MGLKEIEEFLDSWTQIGGSQSALGVSFRLSKANCFVSFFMFVTSLKCFLMFQHRIKLFAFHKVFLVFSSVAFKFQVQKCSFLTLYELSTGYVLCSFLSVNDSGFEVVFDFSYFCVPKFNFTFFCSHRNQTFSYNF